MSLPDIVVITILLLCIFFAIRHIVKTRKNGECSCGCTTCSASCECRKSHNKA